MRATTVSAGRANLWAYIVVLLLAGCGGNPDVPSGVLDVDGLTGGGAGSGNGGGAGGGTTVSGDTVAGGPVAVLEASATVGFAPLTVRFSATGSRAAAGRLADYAWDFGDGETGDSVEVFHTFTEPGLYAVELTVYDERGASGQVESAVAVLPPVEIACSPAAARGVAPLRVQFGVTTMPGALHVPVDVRYHWDFGDGTAGQGPNVVRVYERPGRYTVTLALVVGVLTLRGDQMVVTVDDPAVVENRPPVADAGPDQVVLDANGDGVEVVRLDGSGSHDPDGEIVWYCWSRTTGPEGPGILAEGTKPTADVSLAVGQHETTLTVTDDRQATGQDAVRVAVVARAALAVTPNASFTSAGEVGGSFAPGQMMYTLRNAGQQALEWSASTGQGWLAVSPSKGSLAGGKSVEVKATIQVAPAALGAGVHRDTLTFTNRTNDVGTTTRAVELTVTDPALPLIAGRVVENGGAGVGDVVLDGLPDDPKTDGEGYYLASVPLGWSGTVTPTKAGYTFDPENREYSNVTADQPDQNYVATTAGMLTVTPVEGFNSSGHEGGPFSPASKVYTLENTGDAALDWAAGSAAPWLTVAPASGHLAPGATVDVLVTINANASSLAAGTYDAVIVFGNPPSGAPDITRDVRLTVSVALIYTRGGNISYGWAGTAANDASAGNVAWVNPHRATHSDNQYAAATFSGNESHYLVFSGFELSRDIPGDADITGMEFHIEGKTTTTAPVCCEAAIVKGGVISATNLANNEIVGVYEYRGLYYGDDGERWGESWTAADIKRSDFGLAIRVRSTGNETVEIDSCRVLVHWAKPPTAAVTLSHAPTPMAPCAIHANVLDATIGDSTWEKVGVHWRISGPPGWTMPATDPRPGSWGSSRPRDCATDMWGYNTAIYADVPGTYTISATLYLEDGTTVSDSREVIVAANTRAVRYLKAGGSDAADGTSWANAWATWEHAISRLTDDMELVVRDDDVWHVTSALSNRVIRDRTNLVVRRSGTGAAKPVIEATAAVPVFALLRLTDCVLDGLDIRGIATPQCGVLGAEGDVRRLTFAHVAGSQGHNSFWEKNSGYYNREFLAYNCTFKDIKRYAFYLEGMMDRDIVFIGCALASSTANPPTGEGLLRVGTHYGTNVAVGHSVNVLWCDFEDHASVNGVRHAALRSAASFTHAYQCRFNAVFGVGETANDTSVNLQYVKRYDGLWTRAGAMEPGLAERLYGLMVCNSVFLYSPTQSGSSLNANKHGYYARSAYVNNLFLIETPGSAWNILFSRISQTDGSRARFRDIVLVNNALVTPDPTASNDQVGIYEDSPVATVFERGGRLENNLVPGCMSGHGRWFIQQTWYLSAAAVNALPFVAGEDVVPLVTADLPSAGNYAPQPGLFPLYQSNAKPEPGVWVDYTGALRDHQVPCWQAGPTGA